MCLHAAATEGSLYVSGEILIQKLKIEGLSHLLVSCTAYC